MTATRPSAIDSTGTVADNLGVSRTEANAYTGLARTTTKWLAMGEFLSSPRLRTVVRPSIRRPDRAGFARCFSALFEAMARHSRGGCGLIP
jgi:hypothetical protein